MRMWKREQMVTACSLINENKMSSGGVDEGSFVARARTSMIRRGFRCATAMEGKASGVQEILFVADFKAMDMSIGSESQWWVVPQT
jgi:hypothetical protein